MKKLPGYQCRCLGAGCWLCSYERSYQKEELLARTSATEDEISQLERSLKSAKLNLKLFRELCMARDLARDLGDKN